MSVRLSVIFNFYFLINGFSAKITSIKFYDQNEFVISTFDGNIIFGNLLFLENEIQIKLNLRINNLFKKGIKSMELIQTDTTVLFAFYFTTFSIFPLILKLIYFFSLNRAKMITYISIAK